MAMRSSAATHTSVYAQAYGVWDVDDYEQAAFSSHTITQVVPCVPVASMWVVRLRPFPHAQDALRLGLTCLLQSRQPML